MVFCVCNVVVVVDVVLFLCFFHVFVLCSRAGQETCVQMFFSGHCGQLVNSVHT